MKQLARAFLVICLLLIGFTVEAGAQVKKQVNPEDLPIDMDVPTFVPTLKTGKVLVGHDSIPYVQLNNVYVYPAPQFKNAREFTASGAAAVQSTKGTWGFINAKGQEVVPFSYSWVGDFDMVNY